jgi:hypothetical protein
VTPQARYAEKHKSLGLCKYCASIASNGNVCKYHANYNKGMLQQVRDRRKARGNCPRCGHPLHEEMDEGNVVCITCIVQATVRKSTYRLAG